ncbi:MAG: chromate resistance protein [Sphingomonas sp.]|jgi:rhodanese-related sulfurtransferase|uniref:sulfurtransferase/chromate resistance protein n=1 Tax=Sphingomonas sp. TaxID=28214 RepID=UPI001ACEBE7F|nr:sulfurtransferase/chromate resistance protein [Sphingomonas sp.]MBN8814128.1 chromate resistance protein [Sphingomonas sp.]
MPALHSIAIDKLIRLIGTPGAPLVIDVRSDEERIADPRFIPGSIFRSATSVAQWAAALPSRNAVVVCEQGRATSQGAAAILRHTGISAEALDDGFNGWRKEALPLVSEAALPTRNADGRTTWVTRARPKVDRIACPWLIRRFVDPEAMFLYVPPADVLAVAEQVGGAAFDLEGDGVFWSHREDRCTFDLMVEEFGLGGIEPLVHLATIVRGADTGHPEIVPEAAGLLAASLGLSRMYSDDLEQLEVGMGLYDAFYRWCRDARGETHNWASHRPAARKVDEVRA